MATNNLNDFISASDSNISDLEGEIGGIKNNKATSSSGNPTALNLGYDGSKNNPNYRPDVVSTLDEPVTVTIMRDLKAIGYKFGHVFFPKTSTLLLRDWDLWGPLSLCVLLAILLQGNSSEDANAPEFASLFALFAVGAVMVTVNTKLLSGTISILQSICVLGYCLLPLVIAALFHEFSLYIFSSKSVTAFLFHFCLSVFAMGWSVFASTAFLAADTINLNDRKALAVYPIFLFYFVIGWLVILDTN